MVEAVLGTYVKEFDKSNIDLSLWRGEAKLANVELRPDALDFLNLPLSIRLGFVGKIVVEADWARLSSKPTRVELEDLRLVCGPRSKFKVKKKKKKSTKQNVTIALMSSY
ncbi:chorein [Reticulomyxa filosa]|uniref:Chorein n=1 Tax=Reticulomyxa filosa TaxID=46433 RepID=X6MBA8_RETFI|nr:chorein [Reticulomyxa filosa]|eukprot:ETO10931.1 chorein [Reticulomyxa filosa]